MNKISLTLMIMAVGQVWPMENKPKMNNIDDIMRLNTIASSPKDIEELKELAARVNLNNHYAKPLFEAVETGNVEAIQALIEAGADVNAKHFSSKATPLEIALLSSKNSKNKVEVVALLISNGAKITPVEKDYINRLTDLFPFEDPEVVKSNQAAILALLSEPRGAKAYRIVDRHHYYNASKDVRKEMEKYEKPINIDMESVD
jgi:ankyrin repeat protein